MISFIYSKVDSAGLRYAKVKNDHRSALTNQIPEEEINNFKNTYLLLNDYKIEPQEISSSNTLICGGKEYAIDDVKTKLQIFTENATYRHNGLSSNIPESNIYQTENTKEIVTVVKNSQQEVELLSVSNKISKETASVSIISPKYPGIFAEVGESDYDYDEINNQFQLDQSEEHNDTERNLSNSFQTQSRQRKTEAVCSSYKVVELAAAYESSFCKYYGGKEGADQRIKLIIAGVNDKYKMHACIKVRLSHLEGYCDSNSDPYKKLNSNLSGCSGDGLLDDVGRYWKKNREDIPRDVMHLFTGTGFKDEKYNIVGCATTGTICNSGRAFGVNHITYNRSVNLQAVLVAHELGHNLGARHYDDEHGFIMNSSIQKASNGFFEGTVQRIEDTISQTSCIHKELPQSPPPVSTTFSPSISGTKLEDGRVSIDIKNIDAPETNENKNRMILVVKGAVNAAINNEKINMIFSDHKLIKVETDDNLYNYNFVVKANMHCDGGCDIGKEVKDSIKINFEKNFDTEMRKAADDNQIKHLFRNAQVDINSFTYSSLPKVACRNTMQSLIKRFMSI